jgi:arylsulfatase B
MRALGVPVALLLIVFARNSVAVHLVQMLIDDWGWFNAGWHSVANPEVSTPQMDLLVREGVELDRAYAFKYCSPSRCALQSGRNPLQVNVLNDDGPEHNPADPVGGWMGMARNFTGIATKLKAAGFSTHQIGKWDTGQATPDHTPQGRGYDTSLIYFMHENDCAFSRPNTAQTFAPTLTRV